MGFVNPYLDYGFTKPIHALYLPSAHASVVHTMEALTKEGRIVAEPLPIKDGRVTVDALQKLLRPETVLVSMDAVCGETGTIWNTREVASALREPSRAQRGIGSFLHIDASQAVHTEKLERAHFGADLITFDGGKLGVPGSGCLIAHRTIPLQPIYGGGGQERGLRSGTENVGAIGRFAASLGRAARARESFRARALAQRAELVTALRGIPNLCINVGRGGVPHILNISLPGRDTDYLLTLLDDAGFAVSTRSACETDSVTGSRAVLALTNDPARAAATLRISWSSQASTRSLKRFVAELDKLLRSNIV